MATVKLDKENPSATFGGGKMLKATTQVAELAILNSHTKPNVLSTPKVSFDKQQSIQTINKTARKALGDVINTATRKSLVMGVTPKVNKIIHNCTPSVQKKSNNKEQKSVNNELELPPIDPFIGDKFDNFDDLFSEGKMSTMLFNRNISYCPQLPNDAKLSSNLIDELNVNVNDKKRTSQMKKLNKIIVKAHLKCPTKTGDLLQEQPRSLTPPPQLDDSF
jgi:hypothetical protein